ncbi:MAG: hypothetical protein ACP5C3_04905 [Methanomicrobiales archaeon]
MVLDPKIYREEISNLGIEGLNIKVHSVAEALQLLVELKNIEKTLKKIKYNIRIDMRSLRKHYLDEIKEVEKPVKVMKVFNKKLDPKKSLKIKKKIVNEREHRIKPYELLERLIDDYLWQIDESKKYLQDFIGKKME